MTVSLGTNDFFGVPFPLVLADRFFHIYQAPSGLQLDVFRWDEKSKQAIYEVKAGVPTATEINTNPTGIVTFSEPTKGTFLYKFRPKPGVSQIFGKVPVTDEFEVKIDDHSITVMRGANQVGTFEKNTFGGMPIGIQVDADGSVKMGVNRLPEGMVLMRRFEGQTFENQTIRVDGNNFVRCTFKKCTLTFGASGPVGLGYCELYETTWSFVGAAADTIQFMVALYHGAGEGGKRGIESTFENIRKGSIPKSP